MLRVHLSPHLEGDWPLALPVRAGGSPPDFAAAALAAEFSGKVDTICDIHGGARRILLLGVGDEPNALTFEAAGARAASHALRASRISLDLRGLRRRDAIAFVTGAVLRAWRYEKCRTLVPEDAPRLSDIVAVTDDPDFAQRWARQLTILEPVEFVRDLVTEPSNTKTPDSIITQLQQCFPPGLSLEILRGEALHAANLTGILAVGGAAMHPPALAVLRWPGTIDAPPVAFVGKGITFDTGGISIKPADHMWDMRADMAGAAACAGAILALARRKSPAPAIAILALAENAIGDNAYRPSDILRHANGTTIEVVDTDAEGRLVLVDAIGYAVTQKPQAIIDLATLTGSVVTALGHHMAGIYTNNDPLASAVAAAGAAVGEFVWHMPIDKSHRAAIDSDIADVRHCAPERGQPDASHAAAFLREFVSEIPWVHIDIAGVESVAEPDDRHALGATGFGVRLLDRLIRDRFEDPNRV